MCAYAFMQGSKNDVVQGLDGALLQPAGTIVSEA